MYERLASAPRTVLGRRRLGLAPTYRRQERYEGRGEREKAIESYGKFTTLWAQADPSLQPQVREVRTRMAKLAGE
jgi:hypothetical protein